MNKSGIIKIITQAKVTNPKKDIIAPKFNNV